MKNLLLASIAALFLATGTAHAADDRASDIVICPRAKAELRDNPSPETQAAYDRCIKPATTIAKCKYQFAYGGEVNWTPEYDAAYRECLKHVRATKRQMRKRR